MDSDTSKNYSLELLNLPEHSRSGKTIIFSLRNINGLVALKSLMKGQKMRLCIFYTLFIYKLIKVSDVDTLIVTPASPGSAGS